jgi:CRP-like cAMP-binding protein
MHRVSRIEPLPCGDASRPLAPDCPAVRGVGIQDLVRPGGASCRLVAHSIEPREFLPEIWNGRYAFALVRRGCLVRMRTDSQGRSIAIDVVGPGGAFRLPNDRDSALEGVSSGYAVSRVLLCVSDGTTLRDTLRAGGQSAVDLHECDRIALERMELLADARGRSTALAKVAALLCVLAGSITPLGSERDSIPSGFLQRDLAALVSIRHESVCRALRDLETRGLITQTRDEIRLLDRRALMML